MLHVKSEDQLAVLRRLGIVTKTTQTIVLGLLHLFTSDKLVWELFAIRLPLFVDEHKL
jgi:hypothetical protein